MIGDYVTMVADAKRFPENIVGETIPCKVIGLDLYKTEGVRVANNFEFMDEDPNKLSPMPLTYEILKKNGGIMSDTLAKFDIGNYYVIYEYDGFLTICEDNYNERKISYIDCEYVHQLQHALRLCGINKEIVL